MNKTLFKAPQLKIVTSYKKHFKIFHLSKNKNITKYLQIILKFGWLII